ncbi:MAG: hypothetical protein M1289_02915 [Patescibacteria group bacterium]|nr:hypothetical protein [Patescibacteria group bacterium]
MSSNFGRLESFFNIDSFRFKEIFDHTAFPWEALSKINSYIKRITAFKLRPNHKKFPDVFVGEGTRLEEGVLISGPALIGKNCVIGHGALIRGGCILGDNVHIGHACEIKHSIFLDNAVSAHLNYVGDSVIGSFVNIAAGAVLANLRLDKKNIAVYPGKDKRIDTNLKKFGAIIGDGSNIGVNAVLNPGTILGKNTIVYPLSFVKGIHKDSEIIKDNLITS